MSEEQRKSSIGGIGDGIRTGIGILSAFKDAIEETLEEAVKRGDLSPDRAKRAMKEAADRLQGGFEGVSERLDLVSHRELEELRSEVAELRERVARLEASGPSPEPPSMIVTE